MSYEFSKEKKKVKKKGKLCVKCIISNLVNFIYFFVDDTDDHFEIQRLLASIL